MCAYNCIVGPEHQVHNVQVGTSEKKKKKDTGPVAKENATLAQRIEILNWHHEQKKSQRETATYFNTKYPSLQLKQPIISAWLKDEEKWRQQWENNAENYSAKRIRQTQHPEITDMMNLWVSQAMRDGLMPTGEVLRQKWTQFADLAGIPADERLQLSNGWLDRFKARHNLKEFKRHGEASSVGEEMVEKERERIQTLIKEGAYKPQDIFNMDETGLFYGYALADSSDASNSFQQTRRLPPDRGLADKRRPGVKGVKTRLTYVFTTNADGSGKLKPLVIGKYGKPRAFERKSAAQLGFYYRYNAKAWMTKALYQEWLHEWDLELKQEKRNILLLQDNFAGHVAPDDLQCIRVENFKARLTSHIQPNDQGIIQSFKAHYRARFIERAISRYDTGITPSALYEINQLQAMRLAAEAWMEVDATTIKNCWKKSGILPDIALAIPKPLVPISSLLVALDSQDPVAEVEKRLIVAMDGLQQRGVLQASNRMSLEELLNPVAESQTIDATLDEEIYSAVMEAQHGNLMTNDDSDAEDGPVDPPPTRCEALKAALLIKKYVETMNEPWA